MCQNKLFSLSLQLEPCLLIAKFLMYNYKINNGGCTCNLVNYKAINTLNTQIVHDMVNV